MLDSIRCAVLFYTLRVDFVSYEVLKSFCSIIIMSPPGPEAIVIVVGRDRTLPIFSTIHKIHPYQPEPVYTVPPKQVAEVLGVMQCRSMCSRLRWVERL